jgi:hypothetical protein
MHLDEKLRFCIGLDKQEKKPRDFSSTRVEVNKTIVFSGIVIG